MGWVIALVGIAIATFILWRISSVHRGLRKVQTIIDNDLEPLVKKIEENVDPSPELIRSIAAKPQNRRALWYYLKTSGRDTHFPSELLEPVEIGLAELSRWCMHPNEFEQAPKTIEPLAVHRVHLTDGYGDYYIYRMAWEPSHFTKGEYVLGIAGPFGEDFPPFSYHSPFSRGDREGSCSTKELVEWQLRNERIAPLKIDEAKRIDSLPLQ